MVTTMNTMQQEVLRKPKITPRQRKSATVWKTTVSGEAEALETLCSLIDVTAFNTRWTNNYANLEIRSLQEDKLERLIGDYADKTNLLLEFGEVTFSEEKVSDVFF
jgi:hypothetical protein